MGKICKFTSSTANNLRYAGTYSATGYNSKAQHIVFPIYLEENIL